MSRLSLPPVRLSSTGAPASRSGATAATSASATSRAPPGPVATRPAAGLGLGAGERPVQQPQRRRPGHGGHARERGDGAEGEAGAEQRAQVQRVMVAQPRGGPRGPRRPVGDDDGTGDLGQVDRVDAGDRGPRADRRPVAVRPDRPGVRGGRAAPPLGPAPVEQAARPSGDRHATAAGPGIGMTEGSTASARSVSAAQPSGVAALTASVKNIGDQPALLGTRQLVRRPVGRRLAADQAQPGLGDRAEVDRLYLLVRVLPGGLPCLGGRQGGDRRGHLRRVLLDPARVVDRLRARPVPDHRHRPRRHALGGRHVERLVVAGRQDEPDPAQPGGHVGPAVVEHHGVAQQRGALHPAERLEVMRPLLLVLPHPPELPGHARLHEQLVAVVVAAQFLEHVQGQVERACACPPCWSCRG